MLKNLRGTLLLCGFGALGVAMIACTAGTGTPTGTSGGTSGNTSGGVTPQPEQKAEVTSPTSGLKVSASIASVSLGDECGGSSGAAKGAPAQDCAVGGCQSYCQQTNVQIAFSAGAGTAGAAIQIVKVELMDSASGTLVDTLTSSKPQVWNGSAYASWNQIVTPGGDLKASYDLSSPSWSKIDGSGAGTTRLSGSGSYSRSFKLHVTLLIDGVQIILESTDLNRQPQAVT